MTQTIKRRSPKWVRERITKDMILLNTVRDGLEGKPFRWGSGEARHYIPRLAELGLTLVTKTEAARRGFTVRPRDIAVGTAYFDAPIKKNALLFVLECQCEAMAAGAYKE